MQDLQVKVLDKHAIVEYISKAHDSADSAMKHIKHYPNPTDGRIDKTAWLEIQKINGVCGFLDCLLDGKTFISLPPECTLEDTRKLLEQIQLAEGVRAIAIKLDDSHDSLAPNTLTTAPRLYLALTEKSKPSESDRYFEEILDALTMNCKLPTSEISSSTSTSSVLEEQTECIAEKRLVLPSSGEEVAAAEESEKITPLPGELVENLHPLHHPESLRIEIPARRSHSVPDALSIPWVHHSIPGWRNTSMPSWTLCTHDHHHHYQHENLDNGITPSLVSPPSSAVETIVDGDVALASPICGKGIQSSCMHARELSSDTVITAATSVYSENETIEGDILKIGEKESFGLGIRDDSQFNIQDQQYSRHAQGTRGNYPMDNRNEKSIKSENHFVDADQGGNGKEFNTLYAGSRHSLIKGRGNRFPQPGIPFFKMEQPPCNRHYLLEEGCLSTRCQYTHDYLLSNQEIERLRNDSRKSPCSSLNLGKECYVGPQKCHMGHFCPYGKECRYGIDCRFLKIPGAHDAPPVNEQFAHQARFQKGELTTVIIRNGYIAPPPSPPITPPPFFKKVDNHPPPSPSDHLPINKGFQTAAMRNARPAYDNAPFPLRIAIPMTPPAQKLPRRSLMAPPPVLFPTHSIHPSHPLQYFHQAHPNTAMRPVEPQFPYEVGPMPPSPSMNMTFPVMKPHAVPVTAMQSLLPLPVVSSGAPMHVFYPHPPAPRGKVGGPSLPPLPALSEAPRPAAKEVEGQKNTNVPPVRQIMLNSSRLGNTTIVKQDTQTPLPNSVKPKKKNRKAFVSNKRASHTRIDKQV